LHPILSAESEGDEILKLSNMLGIFDFELISIQK
jgi:hypothetical protein